MDLSSTQNETGHNGNAKQHIRINTELVSTVSLVLVSTDQYNIYIPKCWNASKVGLVLVSTDTIYSKTSLNRLTVGPKLSDPFTEVVGLRGKNICMSDRVGTK